MSDIDKLAWLHLKNRRVLGARSRGQETIYLPGGKRENGESDQAALMREIREELSVNLLPETIEFAGSFRAQAHGKAPGIMVRVTGYFARFSGEIRAAAEIEEVVWLRHRDKAKCSAAAGLILDWLKDRGQID